MKKFMKTLYVSVIAATILVLFAGTGCQKESGLMTDWGRLWYKEYTILGGLNTCNNDVILPNIDRARTTLNLYYWDPDTIVINGPAGYVPLADKATRVLISKYQEVMLPDTAIGATAGELPKIMVKYLELRRENSGGEAYKKLRLYIPKDLYDLDSRAWEFMLDELYAYLTGPLGGNVEWYNGMRDHASEMKIRNILTTGDPEDPWGYSLPAETRIRDKYLNYAEGDNKGPINYDSEAVRAKQAQKRYEHFKSLPGLNAMPEDFATKVEGNCVYVDIPVPPANGS